jgi:hypothetical protein
MSKKIQMQKNRILALRKIAEQKREKAMNDNNAAMNDNGQNQHDHGIPKQNVSF